MAQKMLPSISLCMIVKNEERRLAECLASAKLIAQELIVVDTGSEDRSGEIAIEQGAKVFHHPWEGDFSTARNQSLNYASSDWILILDGDEVLDQESLKFLQHLDFNSPNIDAYTFEIINFTSDLAIKTEAGLLDQVRLFRNRPEHRYDGCVHNQLVNTNTQLPLSQEKSKVQVLHYGYTPEVWAAQNKDARITLHERAVAEDPNNHFIRYNYANHLKILKRYDEALKQFMLAVPPKSLFQGLSYEECLEMPEFLWGTSACFLGAFCANKLKQYEIAIELCQEALERRPWLIDARLRGAEAYIALKNYDLAIELLEPALQRDHLEVLKLKALHFDAPYRLGRALFLSQRQAQATAAFASVLPNCRDITVFTHLALCACTLGVPELWQYARQRGAELAPLDPDWPIVDQQIQQASAHQHQKLIPCEVVIGVLQHFEGDQACIRLWTSQLQQGLSYFEMADHIQLKSLEEYSQHAQISSEPSQNFLLFNIKSDEARLELACINKQGTETLYRLPERYQSLSLAQPEESAALLLAHLYSLHS